MSWLSGWSYRKEIVVDQTDDIGAVNYQIKMLIGESSDATGEQVDCGGHVLSTFNDLRFTTSDGETTIDYWIESLSGVTPNQLATVWIEVPVLDDAADTTIYMYYGKADAAADSDGDATFTFFDHFPGIAIDTSKWLGDTAKSVVASSICTLTATAAAIDDLYAKIGSNTDCRMRTSALIENADYSCIILYEYPYSVDDHLMIYHTSGQTNHSAWAQKKSGSETYHSTQAIGFDAYHIYDMCRLITGTDTVRYFYDDVQVGSDDTNNVPIVTLYPNMHVYGTGVYVKMDWVFLSKYTYTEPTWKTFGSEESATTYKPIQRGNAGLIKMMTGW